MPHLTVTECLFLVPTATVLALQILASVLGFYLISALLWEKCVYYFLTESWGLFLPYLVISILQVLCNATWGLPVAVEPCLQPFYFDTAHEMPQVTHDDGSLHAYTPHEFEAKVMITFVTFIEHPSVGARVMGLVFSGGLGLQTDLAFDWALETRHASLDMGIPYGDASPTALENVLNQPRQGRYTNRFCLQFLADRDASIRAEWVTNNTGTQVVRAQEFITDQNNARALSNEATHKYNSNVVSVKLSSWSVKASRPFTKWSEKAVRSFTQWYKCSRGRAPSKTPVVLNHSFSLPRRKGPSTTHPRFRM
jgi:hypothetical protein